MYIEATSFNKKLFLAKEITIFCNLKTESLYVWLKAKDITVSVLTVYLIFQFVKNFPKLFFYLGLVINGASWQQLLRNLDPVTVTRMYNQLLKLINERREQKKMIEERVLEIVGCLNKIKLAVSSSRPKKMKMSCLEFKTEKK